MDGQIRLRRVPTLLDGMKYLESTPEASRVAWYEVEGLREGEKAVIEEEPHHRGEHRWRVQTTMRIVDASIGLRLFPSPEAALQALVEAINGSGSNPGNE